MPYQQLLSTYQARVEYALDKCLPKEDILPHTLHKAMRYCALTGGKRIRPVLVYATGTTLGTPLAHLDNAACAVELIHAYSLVHDDLPAMDDDDLRRGQPTCHIAFDEATAILTGDALQALAFHCLAHDPHAAQHPAQQIKMMEILAQASGSRGMVGGQAIDLESVNRNLNLAELENMHIHKTGALIRASVQLGALSHADIDTATLDKLDHYAKCIGLAFQIVDDILDVEMDTETLGKSQGSDQARNKPTYPSVVGLSEAKQLAQDLYQEAIAAVADLDEGGTMLTWIAEYIIRRQR